MKLSTYTLNILKNYSRINQSIWIDPGNLLATISQVQQNVFTKAVIPDSFSAGFGIHELNKFLSVIAMFDMEKCDIRIEPPFCIITEGPKEIKYTLCGKEGLELPPSLEVELGNVTVEFDISEKQFKEITSFLHILGSFFGIVGENGSIYLKVLHPKDSSASVFSVKLGDTDKKFQLIFKSEVIDKLLAGVDYHVSIGDEMTLFEANGLEYFIAPEGISEYPE